MLGEPGRTEYDISFELLGFPVRVSVGFWIMGIILGYGSAAHSSNRALVLLLWICVLFVSILVHELGHALAFRRYGIHSGIVLYHFGGLAVPRGSFRGSGSLSPWQKIIVSFAGPASQLALAGLILAFLLMNHYSLPWFLDGIPGLPEGRPIESLGMRSFIDSALFVNVFWSLLNLLPIWPLDGGQIARETVHLMGGTIYHSSAISIGCCLVVAVLAWQNGFRSPFTLLFLGSFAFTNYQIMTGSSGRDW